MKPNKPRAGLFGGMRNALSQRGLAQTNDAGISRGEQLGAMLMSLAGPQQAMMAQQNLMGARQENRAMQQAQQAAQGEQNTALKEAIQRRQTALQRGYSPELADLYANDAGAFNELVSQNYEAANVSPGATRVRGFGDNYTAPEMAYNDGQYVTQTPDSVRVTGEDALFREGMTADVANTRAGTANTYNQIQDRNADNARADMELANSGNRPNFNAQQTTSAEYANRMMRANATLEALLNPQDDPNTPDVNEAENRFDPSARARGRNIPFIGDALRGDTARQFDQAADEFALAVLRRESGAAISPAERAEVAALYFPQPGDGPGVIAQKARAREEVISGMVAASSGAYEGLYGQSGPASQGADDPLGLR